MAYNVGESTEPCGKPAGIFLGEEQLLSTHTSNDLSDKKCLMIF